MHEAERPPRERVPCPEGDGTETLSRRRTSPWREAHGGSVQALRLLSHTLTGGGEHEPASPGAVLDCAYQATRQKQASFVRVSVLLENKV